MKISERLTVEDILDHEENSRIECNHKYWDYIGLWRGTSDGSIRVYEGYKCSICSKMKYIDRTVKPF